MSKKIFVAGPFNSPDVAIKEERITVIKDYCVRMFREGHSPISALLMGLVYAEHADLTIVHYKP